MANSELVDFALSLLVEPLVSKAEALKPKPVQETEKSKTEAAEITDGLTIIPKRGVCSTININSSTIGALLVKFDALKGRSLEERYTNIFDEDPAMLLMAKTLDVIKWPAHELKFYLDIPDYQIVALPFKRITRGMLAFSLFGDGVVTDNLLSRFINEANTTMEKWFLIKQMEAETIHQETYLLFAFTYEGNDLTELRQYENSPPIQAKVAWMERWMGTQRSRAERLFAFICVEGIIFPCMFLIPTFLQELGMMLTFAFGNKMIARDESKHCEGTIVLLKREQIKSQSLLLWALEQVKLVPQYTQVYQAWHRSDDNLGFLRELTKIEPELVPDLAQLGGGIHQKELPAFVAGFNIDIDGVKIVDELLVILDSFADHFIPEPLTGIYAGFTNQGWKNYARFMADQILVSCGGRVHYHGTNNFPFTERQGTDGRNNFFETEGVYAAGNVTQLANWRGRIAQPRAQAYSAVNDDREI